MTRPASRTFRAVSREANRDPKMPWAVALGHTRKLISREPQSHGLVAGPSRPRCPAGTWRVARLWRSGAGRPRCYVALGFWEFPIGAHSASQVLRAGSREGTAGSKVREAGAGLWRLERMGGEGRLVTVLVELVFATLENGEQRTAMQSMLPRTKMVRTVTWWVVLETSCGILKTRCAILCTRFMILWKRFWFFSSGCGVLFDG